jgi:hypothetical protein
VDTRLPCVAEIDSSIYDAVATAATAPAVPARPVAGLRIGPETTSAACRTAAAVAAHAPETGAAGPAATTKPAPPGSASQRPVIHRGTITGHAAGPTGPSVEAIATSTTPATPTTIKTT